MAKVTVVQVVYNSRALMEEVFSALFRQTVTDFEAVAVICGNADAGKQFLAARFPQVRILDPGQNLGFAGGNNLAFRATRSEFYQLLNPDLVLEPAYLERLLESFADPAVGAATGKLRLYNKVLRRKTNIIDTTGIVMQPSGRPYDRGQGEEDRGQYDSHTEVFACSGAGVMLRRAALDAVAAPGRKPGRLPEYFDETFHTYWEDVDLCWRMRHASFVSRFVPAAVAYHGRGIQKAGERVLSAAYLKNYYAISRPVRRNIVANYFFTFIKNSPAWPLAFWRRALSVAGFVLLCDWPSIPGLGRVVRLLPDMLRKRKSILSAHT